jgi:hypothetical protein
MKIDPKKIAKMISEDPNVPSDHFDDTEDEYRGGRVDEHGIAWTNTWYGSGGPTVGNEAIQRVISAYHSIHGTVAVIAQEDFGFVSVENYLQAAEHYGFFRPDNEEDVAYAERVQAADPEVTASSPAEAVRLWWNIYGVYGSDDGDGVIYNNGQGPHGIGGFRDPTNL